MSLSSTFSFPLVFLCATHPTCSVENLAEQATSFQQPCRMLTYQSSAPASFSAGVVDAVSNLIPPPCLHELPSAYLPKRAFWIYTLYVAGNEGEGRL